MKPVFLDLLKLRERHTNLKSSWYEAHESMDRSMTSLKADPDSAHKLPTLAPQFTRFLVQAMNFRDDMMSVQRRLCLRLKKKEAQEAPRE